MKTALQARLNEYGLQLHPRKTRIAYCANANRRQQYETVRFDFLSYTFKPRQALKRRGKLFTIFSPAVSYMADKSMRQKIRHLGLQRLRRYRLEQLSIRINKLVDGWFRYFGLFHRSALQHALRKLDLHIVKWAMKKFKRLHKHKTRAWNCFAGLRSRAPRLFLHLTIDWLSIGR